jgi:hypothetical protein
MIYRQIKGVLPRDASKNPITAAKEKIQSRALFFLSRGEVCDKKQLMSKTLPAIFLSMALFVAAPSSLFAQAPEDTGREFIIEKVEATLESTPKHPGPSGKSSTSRTKWMQIEVLFTWQNKKPTGPDGEPLPEFLDELEVEVYALLNTRVDKDNQAALLTGSTTLVHVPQDKNLALAMYVSPKLLDQLFAGKAPSAVSGALVGRDTVGAVLKYNGQVVATFPETRAGAPTFWEDLKVVRLTDDVVTKVEDGILPKWQTPFAFSNWDFYQQEKIGD